MKNLENSKVQKNKDKQDTFQEQRMFWIVS